MPVVPIVSFVLVGTGTLPVWSLSTPSEYQIGHYTPGSVQIMGNGRPVVMATRSVPLKEFTLRWNAILSHTAQFEGAFKDLCTGQTQFTDPNGDTWFVIRHPDQPKLEFKPVVTGLLNTSWRWQVEMRLVENP